MKAKTLFGLLLSFSLLFTGCGGSSNRIEFDKNKDYKPDEVKKIVYHTKQSGDIIALVDKKLTKEEAKKLKRSLFVTHETYGAQADGKTIEELFDLKLTREEILKFKFNSARIQATYDAVSLSPLSDKEKKAIENCIRGFDPRIWDNKTIEEMLALYEKYSKGEWKPQKIAPAVAGAYGANELLNAFYEQKSDIEKQLTNKTIKITGPVVHKDFQNGHVILCVGHFRKVNSYWNFVDERTFSVALNSSDVNLLNRLQENMFISVVGTFAGKEFVPSGDNKIYYYYITNAQITN